MIKSFSEWLKECDNISNKDYDSIMLSESKRSLSRFMSHLKYDNMIIVMSVDRNPFRKNEDGSYPDLNTRKQRKHDNESNRVSFRSTLCHLGSTFIPVIGTYNEEDPITKKTEKIKEHSFVIFIDKGDFGLDVLETCIRSAKKYQQDSILAASKEIGYFYYTRDCNGHKEGDFELIGGFHPTKIGDYYSTFGNNVFDREFDNCYYFEKGTRKRFHQTPKHFEFDGFPNDKVSKFLNENIIDFDHCVYDDLIYVSPFD